MESQLLRTSSSRGMHGASGNRQVWSSTEKAALVQSLKQVIEDRWKCENGFCPGYLVQLEKGMKKILGETDIRSEPHISSKMHVWKRVHGILAVMLGKSGFAWDNDKKRVIVESDSVWDEFDQVEPNAKGMRFRSFPLYPEWSNIFGKDRATGEHAEDFETATTINVGADENARPTTTVPMEKQSETDETQSSQGVSGSSSGAKRSKRKLKEIDMGTEQVINLMGKFSEQTNEHLGDIAQYIGYEFAMSSKRNKVFGAHRQLGVLNAEDTLTVGRALVNNNKDLDFFFSLPEEERTRMVLMMISGKY